MKSLTKLVVSGLLSTPLLVSCGGSHIATSTAASKTGRATMTIKWPARNARVIPTAANSIVIALTQGSKTIASSGPIARPANGGTSNWTTPGVQPGTYTISAQAFPNADGSGTTQASGAGTISIVYNTTAQASVTMGSTVTSLACAPAKLYARPNSSFNASAVATDAAQNIVMASDSDVTWKISDPTVLQLVTGGTHAQFKGLKAGSATVACTFNGVDTSIGQKVVTSPSTTCAVSSPGVSGSYWPLMRGNQQGNPMTNAPASSQQVAWSIDAPNDELVCGIAPDGSLLLTGFTPGPALSCWNSGGSVRWTSSAQAIFGRTLIASDGSIYAPTDQGIAVLNPVDGSQIASYPAYGNTVEFVLGSDGSIYWADTDNGSTLNAINPDGSVKWSLSEGPCTCSPIMATDGTLFFGVLPVSGQPPVLVSVKQNGTVNWVTPVPQYNGVFVQLISAPNGSIFTLDNAGVISAFSSGGSVLWQTPQTNVQTGMCVDSQSNVYGNVGGKLCKFDANSGTETILIDNPIHSSSLVSNVSITDKDVLLAWGADVNKQNSQLTAYDTTGTNLWSVNLTSDGPGISRDIFPAIGPDGSIAFSVVLPTVFKIGGTGTASRHP